jgi:hypothetical protein
MAALIRSSHATALSKLAPRLSNSDGLSSTEDPVRGSIGRRSFSIRGDSNRQGAVLVRPTRNNFEDADFKGQGDSVGVISRDQLRRCRHWQSAFALQHKDHRYYEIVHDTIHSEFKYLYFAIRNFRGEIGAIQPFFLLDLDILGGIRPYFRRWIDAIRVLWPRFMCMKAMMVGCVAGEAHLDDGDDSTQASNA